MQVQRHARLDPVPGQRYGSPDVPYDGMRSVSRKVRRMQRLRALALNLLFTLAILGVGWTLLVTWQAHAEETRLKALEVVQMQRELSQVQAQNEALRRQVRFLNTPHGVEKVARERLGLVRPNETSYVVVNAPRLEDPKPTPAAKPTPPASQPDNVLSWMLQKFRKAWNGGD
jgi:cell division protein FtsB